MIKKKKYVVVFPGQGCQYKMMADMQNYEAKKVFEEASQVLGYDIKEKLHSLTMGEMTKAVFAQPMILACSIARYRSMFKKKTVDEANILIGHSLGEISAYVAGGLFSLEEGLKFTQARGRLLDQFQTDQAYAALALDVAQDILEKKMGSLQISGYNSERQFIVVGKTEELESLEDKIETIGGSLVPFKMMPMKSPIPFHSKYMKDIIPKIEKLCQKIEDSNVNEDSRILSTVTGKRLQKQEFRKVLTQQMIQPVKWLQVFQEISKESQVVFVDIGPNCIMKNLIKENQTNVQVYGYDQDEDRKKMEEDMLMEVE